MSADAITSDGFTLSWNQPPERDWNGQIRQFVVLITEENTGREFELTTSTNVIEVNFLHPYYTYSCRVTAVTVSPGPYSSPISVTTLSAGMHTLSSLLLGWDIFITFYLQLQQALHKISSQQLWKGRI